MKNIFPRCTTRTLSPPQTSSFMNTEKGFYLLADNVEVTENTLRVYADAVDKFNDKDEFIRFLHCSECTGAMKSILPKITFNITPEVYEAAAYNDRYRLAVSILLERSTYITTDIIEIVSETIKDSEIILEKMVDLCTLEPVQDVFDVITNSNYPLDYVKPYYKKWENQLVISEKTIEYVNDAYLFLYLVKKMPIISANTINLIRQFPGFTKSPFRPEAKVYATEKEAKNWSDMPWLAPHLQIVHEVVNDTCFICMLDDEPGDYTYGFSCAHRVHTNCCRNNNIKCFCGKQFCKSQQAQKTVLSSR